MTINSETVFKNSFNNLNYIMTAEEYIEYINESIRYWRKVRDGEQAPPQGETRDIAKYYIDAFQCARVKLTEQELGAEEILGWT